MLSEILEVTINEQPDMEVVTTDTELSGRAEASDVIITGEAGLERVSSLLMAHPSLRIFAVNPRGRAMSLFELQPKRVALGEVSPSQLVAEIRSGRRLADWASQAEPR
jgi:hypothetical protein